MKRPTSIALATIGVLASVSAIALVTWLDLDRAGMISTLCKTGMPNFSRPAEVDADMLGCAVLGPKRRLSGSLYAAFEASDFTITDPAGSGGGVSAWFSGTEGLRERGGSALEAQLAERRPGLCGGRMARVTADGWMTVSAGRFGHLGMSEREFFAYRIVSASAPTADELAHFSFDGVNSDPGFAKFCREQESDEVPGR